MNEVMPMQFYHAQVHSIKHVNFLSSNGEVDENDVLVIAPDDKQEMAIIGDLTLYTDYALAFYQVNTAWLFKGRLNYFAASAITDLYHHNRKIDYLSIALLLRAYSYRYDETRRFSNDMTYWKNYIRQCRYASNSISHFNKRADYGEYLNSPHWHLVRAAAIVKADYRCQLCNSPDNLQVHHRTYERRGKEKLSDVTVLCRDCHRKFHGIASS